MGFIEVCIQTLNHLVLTSQKLKEIAKSDDNEFWVECTDTLVGEKRSTLTKVV